MGEPGERYLERHEEQVLLALAHDTLGQLVRHGTTLSWESSALTDTLREKHGAFVTLRNAGNLRGCVGYTANRTPLAQSVRDCTISAASRDSRFPPVVEGELYEIQVEISALTPGDTPDTPFKRVYDLMDLSIGRDGLYIVLPPQRGGLLLPQVGVEQGFSVDQFLAATCRKGGYAEDAYRDTNAEVYRFSAQVFGDT
jgi:AmmeMemoRadiSam system protein A